MPTELRKDPLFSFIVPVYKVPKSVFKRCIMSMVEQDYENKEIVLVFDGVDPELLDVVLPFMVKNKNIRVKEIEHSGACAARNAGFNESKGEIVSFFNSDYVAKAGMVKMWVDALMDHPEHGFAYGAYEYASAKRSAYWSKPFDEYELTQANYIDCGFPLWRKYVVEWDPSVKSLQDWDFWIRVVKTHKVTGYYLEREISFVAELPRPGGLSQDSHNNWADRIRFVREKNDIPSSSLVVTSIGAPYHGKEIAKMLGANFHDQDTILKPNGYDAVYMIGFYMKPSDRNNLHPQIMASYEGKKRIIHFVGADIHWLKTFPHNELKMVATAMNVGADHVLCETTLAQEELEDLGINSKVVPIPPYNDYEVKPLPDKFSVAVFLTDKSDFDKYCQKETLSIVRALPHIQFNAYGDGGKGENYPNLNHHGNLNKQEWKDFVYSNSAYLRLVRHDTRPLASDEFLMAGRRVITNVPTEYVDLIDTKGDLKKGEWDIFQTGLNPYHWPNTKKLIVQKILECRNINLDDVYRNYISKELKDILNKEKYISTIYELAGIESSVKELSVI